MKSLALALGLASEKVATVPWNACPAVALMLVLLAVRAASAALKLTGMTSVMWSGVSVRLIWMACAPSSAKVCVPLIWKVLPPCPGRRR